MYYEIFAKLCAINKVKPGTVSKATGISTATLTSWKQGKYTPKQDKMQKIADYFGVSVDFLTGNADAICCQECSTTYNPLDDVSKLEHEVIHMRYELAIVKYGVYYQPDICREVDIDTTNVLNGTSASFLSPSDLEFNYTQHIKSNFSHLLRQKQFKLDYESFEEYAREQVINDMHKNFMTKDLFELLAKKYGIDLSQEDKTEEIPYYLNEETKEIAQEIFENKELRMLFDAAQDASPEDLETVHSMLLALKRKERGNVD